MLGSTEQGYSQAGISTATKTDTRLLDTPQAITVITRDLISDQAMASMADAIRYIPGIVVSQGEGNRDAAIFRGNSSTGDFYMDGIRDDVMYYRDFYNIERVEALKGSSAMIFGRGGAGGVINRVSKQARYQPVREAVLSFGAHSHKRVAIDLGDAVNAEFAVRVNAMAENSDSFRNGMHLERKGINPTATWRAGRNTVLSVAYEHFQDERVGDRGLPSLNGRPYGTDISTFFGNASLSPNAVRLNAFSALLEHDFGSGLTLRNRARVANYDKYYQNVFAGGAVSAATGRLAVGAYRDETRRDNRFNQTDLLYSLAMGPVRHKLAFGAEFGRQETDGVRRNGVFPGGAPTMPASAPLYTGGVSFATISSDSASIAHVASGYLQDQLELSPQWQAVLGVRYDRFNVEHRNRLTAAELEVTDTPVSPRAGLIYKPVPTVSIYASYSRAFAPRSGDQLTSLSVTNKTFDPERFSNYEAGIKWDVAPGLAATAAVYKLDRSNVIVPGAVAGTSILVDGQTSKGVELGLSGQVTRAWSVAGGYAYQDAELTADQSATVKAGARVAQVPRHTFSLWNRVDVNARLGAALGVVYRDCIFTSTANTVLLPSYTRIDGALYYSIGNDYRLQLNVENLFDKKYYASAHGDNNIMPGAPRSFKLTLNAQF
ncbi:TonB-dependent receptor [Pseudoduganella sp. OTU4001]|uniref:TonB-dependent receptor n=1 Tax=Pseudoduganella sp. OTU4001 TaxID=3043854 RepID=UPI00313C0A64